MNWTKLAKILSIILGVIFLYSVTRNISALIELNSNSDSYNIYHYGNNLLWEAIKSIFFYAVINLIIIFVLFVLASCATSLQNIEFTLQKNLNLHNKELLVQDSIEHNRWICSVCNAKNPLASKTCSGCSGTKKDNDISNKK